MRISSYFLRVPTTATAQKSRQDRDVFRGKLELELSPVDLIQITCLTGRDGKLVIRSQSRVGSIVLHGGRIVSAEVGTKHGEEALFEIAVWPEGEFLFAPTDVEPLYDIAADTNTLLIEAARIRDEATKAGLNPAIPGELLDDDALTELSPLQRAYAEFLAEKQVYEAAHPEIGTRRKARRPGRETPWFGIIVIVLMLAAGLGVTLYLLLGP